MPYLLELQSEPRELEIISFSLSYPEDGSRATGTVLLAGDQRAHASARDLYINATVTYGDKNYTRRRGPYRAVGTYTYDPQTGDTSLPIIQQGNPVAADFVPLVGHSVSENLDRNWPGLEGKDRLPAWLLAAPVDVPLDAALNFTERSAYFEYLLGGFGYSVAETETGGWVLVGGALADELAADLPFEQNAESRDTLSVPGLIYVRGQEEKSATPPPETEEQIKRRTRVQAILAQAVQQGRVSREEQ
ncbi:hypothetical protein [Deinococcus fonticola]|uniref:hypothetical protein n=1 Tax=Deinococcus fonticola TaxID=2528713 RepID=UPI00107574E2|nr:hypothetical protein [Deinococcus fonticola]